MNWSAMCTLALLGGLLLPAEARATMITIENWSFETDATTTIIENTPPWVPGRPHTTSAWNINASPYGYWDTPAPDGDQVGVLANVGEGYAELFQSLSSTLTANTTYRLGGYVGHPRGYSLGTIYTVDLLAGSSVLASISGTGPDASFSTWLLDYDSTGSPWIGETLGVRLSTNKAQTTFDAITLEESSSPVAVAPEPSTLVLVASGLLAFGSRRLRRRAAGERDRSPAA